MFRGAEFPVAQNTKQPKRPSAVTQINSAVYTMEYYAAVKMNEL